MSKDADLAARITRRSQDRSVRLAKSERQETVASLLQQAVTYYTELQEENKALQQERETFVQEIANLGKANVDLLQTMTHLQQTQDDLQAQVTTLTEANTRLKAMVQDLTWKAKSADQLTQELQTIRKDLQGSRKLLDAGEQERRSLSDQLRQERGAAQQEMAKLRDANVGVQAELTKLTEANTRLKAMVQDLTWKAKSVDQLTQELQTIHKHLDDIEEERRKASSQLQQERHAAQSELAKLRADLTQLGETHARLTQHAEQLQQDLQGSRKRLDAGEQERHSLSDQLQQQRRKTSDQLRQEQQAAQQEMAKLRNANAGTQAELTKLTEANTRLKAMVQDLTWKAQAEDQVKDQFVQERHTLEQDTLKLRRQAQQGKAFQEENILLRQAQSGVQKELAKLREDNARLQAEVHKAQLAEQLRQPRPATTPQRPQPQEDELARLQDSNLSLQAELTKLTETNGHLEALAQELKWKLQNAEQLKEQFREERKTLEQEHQQLKEKSEAAQEHLDRERASLYRELGAVYTKTQLFDNAIDAYTRSLEFDPTNAQAHYYLGLLYQHAKNNDDVSVAHLERYLKLSPDLNSKKRKEVEYLIQMLGGKNNGP